jgi:hypothetical protein
MSMAAPTVTSVTNNGGPPVGGTTVTLAGTGFTNATTVKFGNLSAASFKVESSTEIKAVTPQSINAQGNQYIVGPVGVVVTTPEGSNVGTSETAETFVFWPPSSAVVQSERLFESVAVGAVKNTTTKSPVSYYKAAGAETQTLALQGDYSKYDYVTVETNFAEITGTPEFKISLEDSFDGGLTWEKTTGFTETAAIVAGTPVFTSLASEGKQFGPKLRIAIKSGAAGGAAGTITVYTQTAKVLDK